MDHFLDSRFVKSILWPGEGDRPPLGAAWTEIRDVLMKALWPFDEARRVVQQALFAMGRMPAESPS